MKNILISALMKAHNLYWICRTRKSASVLNTHLTRDEKRAIKNAWGGVNKCYKSQSRFKRLEHFDADFLCSECLVPYVYRALNGKQRAKAYEHKSLYPMMYGKIPQPKYYINCINGVFFDNAMNIVSKQKCIEIFTSSRHVYY